MAEEIIDLRERIEKMRIEINKENLLQKVNNEPIEVHHKMTNTNISMSLQKKFENEFYQNEVNKEVNELNSNIKPDNKDQIFPSVSLSVKNPISSKLLVAIIILQLLSNIGILYFLYLGME
jgi:hypothetical protein